MADKGPRVPASLVERAAEADFLSRGYYEYQSGQLSQWADVHESTRRAYLKAAEAALGVVLERIECPACKGYGDFDEGYSFDSCLVCHGLGWLWVAREKT